MKHFPIFVFLLSILVIASCKKIEEVPLSDQALLLRLDLEFDGSTFTTDINDANITLERPLPYGTEEVQIKYFDLSLDATGDINIGEVLSVSKGTVDITITAQDGTSQKTYTLTFSLKEEGTIVEKHGLLKTKGNQIVDKNDEVVSFAGNSFFWSNNGWGGEKYYRSEVVSWLKLDWDATIVRAAIGVEDSGGFIESPLANKNKITTVIDAAIAEGLYVIIDWHSHHAEDHPDEAVEFFEEMATLYGDYDNVIYEIYNEPLNVSWSSVLKPYAEKVIAAIRAIDPDNMIIMGTPEWSQKVDLAAADPISDPNIAYTLHFYTIHHQQWLRDRATDALNAGIPLFITEWGSVGFTSSDPETDLWMDWCRQNNISHCNWAVNDKVEEWSILNAGASTTAKWSDSDISHAGKLARKIIRGWAE